MNRFALEKKLFDAAIGLPTDQREAFVRENSVNDSSLCDAVLHLLAEDSTAAKRNGDAVALRLEKIAKSSVDITGQHSPWPLPTVGSSVGPYTVVGILGHGGMGSVLAAQRIQGDIVQRVAIKLIQNYGLGSDANRRFLRECALLARMEHPGIARFLDFGEYDAGNGRTTPYLAMEQIDGDPLNRWLDEKKPPLETRLRIFAELCDAVQHAHRHLIVHRDLKPANVLVTASNAPKLLDFGIAKMLAAADAESFGATQVMTPAYASPEQLRGESVTTLSDVYGLGLILYELLTAVPLRSQSVSTNSAWATQVIKPSQAALQSKSTWITEGARRLRGDLDFIVLKALRENPAGRFETAALLATEVRRFLSHKPLESRRGEWRYSLKKFLSRHPLGVFGSSVAIISLLLAGFQLERERDYSRSAEIVAQHQAMVAKQTTQYMANMFRGADPALTRGKEITAREMLDKGFAQLQKNTIDSAEVRAQLYRTFGETYLEIGMPEPALEGLHQALQLMPKDPTLDESRAQLLEALSDAQLGASQIDQALISAQAAMEIYERVSGPTSAKTAHALISTGIALQAAEKFSQAGVALQRALLICQSLPEQSALKADALQYLGVLAMRTQQTTQSEGYLRQALAIKQSVLGNDHPSTLDTLQSLSFLLQDSGDVGAFENVVRELVDGRGKVHGIDSSPYFQALLPLSKVLIFQLKLREAQSLNQLVIEGFAKVNSKPIFEDSIGYGNFALALEERGDLTGALAWQNKALAVREREMGQDSRPAMQARYGIVRLHWLEGNTDQATSAGKLLMTDLLRVRGAEYQDTLDLQFLLLLIDAKLGDNEAIENARMHVLPKLIASRSMQSPTTIRQALMLAENDQDNERALKTLQEWQPRATKIPLLDALFAIALAERQLQRDANSPSAKAQTKNLVAPFSMQLHAELLASSKLLKRLQKIEE
jgi:eukaryotic-like serine/threonine-protein kinase